MDVMIDMSNNIVRDYVNVYDELTRDVHDASAYEIARHVFALMCDDINDTELFTRDDTNPHVNVDDIRRDMTINTNLLAADAIDPDHLADAATDLADAFDAILRHTPSFTIATTINDPRITNVRFLDDDERLHDINVVTRTIVRL